MTTTAHVDPADQHAGKRNRELEWQLAAANLSAVRHWLTDHAAIDGLSIEPRPTVELHDTYLDTDDWRMHRAGLALRVRCTSGNLEATLKGLSPAQAGFADRRELTEALPETRREALLESPGPVGMRVVAVAGDHALRELFDIRTTRQRFAVRGKDGTSELGEIALDETVISPPQGQPLISLNRVEVESLTGAPKSLAQLVGILRTQCGLDPVADSKYEMGLKSLGLVPPETPRRVPITIDAAMRMEEVALANLRHHLSVWFACEAGARLGDDPEELHDLRVATRRMDVTLGMLEPYLRTTLMRVRPTLKKLLQTFGTVRDLDVELAQVDAFALDLSASEHAALEPLTRYLQSERTQARVQMLTALDAADTKRCIEKLTRGLAHSSRPQNQVNDIPAVTAAPGLIRRRYRKLRKAAARLTAHSSIDDAHRVRRQGKKLRYAIESVAAIYGRPADEMLRVVRRLQDELGTQQDAHVAQRRLLALANNPPTAFSPQTIFLMGRMAERHGNPATGARKRVAKVFGKVRGRRWKALRKRIDDMNARPRENSLGESVAAAQPTLRSPNQGPVDVTSPRNA